MKPQRKQKLLIIGFLTLGLSVAVGLAMYALTENINLFYNPTQIAANDAPIGAKIRAGGMVREGSVERQSDSLTVEFLLTDYANDVRVRYTGILPDLFREGQGIVALGRIREDNVFVADEVLAKHDENYMPPEVAEALEKSGHSAKGIDYNSKEEGSY